MANKNMSKIDRIIRVLIAIVLAGMYFTGRVGGSLGIAAVVVAAIFLVTSAIGFCPGYLPFKKKSA